MEYSEKILADNIETLNKQSRSFAIPILKLGSNLQIPIIVEYNLNKTIDSIEDSIKLSKEEKITLIDEFCNALQDGKISDKVKTRMLEIAPSEDKFVFKNYEATILLYNALSAAEKKLAINKTVVMAEGMKQYLGKVINTFHELNEYCYFVAGSVGEYLVDLLTLHYEIPVDTHKKLLEYALGFGRFLQKLNILRDYQEDIQRKEFSFWPREIINHYSSVESLNILCRDTVEKDAFMAINFYASLPAVSESFDNFIKFILLSGLEYIKILKNNNKIFGIGLEKVKLPKTIITSLYNRVKAMSKDDFINKCNKIRDEELEKIPVVLTS